jgi:hypothetical protein
MKMYFPNASLQIMTFHYARVALLSVHEDFHGFINKEEAKKRNGKNIKNKNER